jgi:putative ABC transport system permease protein
MLANTLAMALREIRRNLLRSGLTVLGVVIGVAAVVVIVTLSAGTTKQVATEIAKMGANMLVISPGGDPRMAGAAAPAPPFDLGDVDALRREATGLGAIAPYAQRTALVVAGDANGRMNIVGTTSDILSIRNWKLVLGRVFTPSEERAGNAVCIIGATVRNVIMSGQAVGANLRVDKLSCEVIGVLEPKGETMFGGDQDATVVLPIRTYQRRIAGSDKIQQIFLSAVAPELRDDLKTQAASVMRERRHMAPGSRANFNIMDMTEVSDAMENTIDVMTMFLSAIATVSLLVGGIGIMNMMLVSVTERTREIGIRLAIGATEGEIMLQFLAEAAVLSTSGGLAGVVAGLLIAAAIAPAIEVPFVFAPVAILGAVVFSAVVGIGFGFMPARGAARLTPIDALRRE